MSVTTSDIQDGAFFRWKEVIKGIVFVIKGQIPPVDVLVYFVNVGGFVRFEIVGFLKLFEIFMGWQRENMFVPALLALDNVDTVHRC